MKIVCKSKADTAEKLVDIFLKKWVLHSSAGASNKARDMDNGLVICCYELRKYENIGRHWRGGKINIEFIE